MRAREEQVGQRDECEVGQGQVVEDAHLVRVRVRGRVRVRERNSR